MLSLSRDFLQESAGKLYLPDEYSHQLVDCVFCSSDAR